MEMLLDSWLMCILKQNWLYINLQLFTNWAESIHPFSKNKNQNNKKIINHYDYYDSNTMVMWKLFCGVFYKASSMLFLYFQHYTLHTLAHDQLGLQQKMYSTLIQGIRQSAEQETEKNISHNCFNRDS